MKPLPTLDEVAADPGTATALTPAERNPCVLKCSAVLAAPTAVTADTTASSVGENESSDDRPTRRLLSIRAMNATVLLINVLSIDPPMASRSSAVGAYGGDGDRDQLSMRLTKRER